ncbi:MAG TPA: hypothetical protein VF980_19945 [Thermoanaerobaculia bacterium]
MTAGEERAIELASRAGGWNITPEQKRAVRARLDVAWLWNGPLLAAVFFVLTALAVAALFFLCEELHLPKGWITAILCVAIAELLIRRFHFGGTGVESALWLGGLFAWIFALPSEGKPEGLLLLAAACAIAGARVRNPLIGAGGPILVIAYLAAREWWIAALIAGIAIAAASLFARARGWERPSTDNLFAALLVICPIAGAVASIGETSLLWAFAYVALAIVELAFAIRLRDRISLVAAAVSSAIALIVLRDLFRFALEWRLIAAGTLMFAISVAVARALRGRTRGFVVTPVKNAYEEALRVFGSAAFAPKNSSAQSSQPVGGGGNFGGAGATGTF